MNKVFLMGFVGSKPEKRGERVVVFRLATHRRGYTKQDGSVVPDTSDWHNITVFEQRASDFCLKHVDKGSMLIVEGEIKYSTYTDATGVERQGVEIIASNVSFPNLGKRKEGNQNVAEPVQEEKVSASEPQGEDLPF